MDKFKTAWLADIVDLIDRTDTNRIICHGKEFILTKHGYWKGKPIAGYSTVRCSECGDVFMENSGKWNYCPNCGTKMDEVIK